MNPIEDIVDVMSDSDNKQFIAYLNKKTKRTDAQNVKLFKSLITDDIKYIKAKQKSGKDAYHAARKRLYDNLVNFMADKTFVNDTSEENEILRLLVVSRTFFEHRLTKAAFKCLLKAEVKALHTEHFGLLNEIYHTQIQFAHLYPSLSLDKILQKLVHNKEKLQQEEQLNLAYAVLRYELHQIYHEGKIVNLQQVINNTIKSFGISLGKALTYKSLYQILFIVNEYASINSDFSIAEPFILRSYKFISAKPELAERHLYYHIYILYFMANMHFRNTRFADSLDYLEQMHLQMQKQDKKHYKSFFSRYSLLKALNENYSGTPEAAIATAGNALGSKTEPADINDLRLALIVFFMQQDDNSAARKYMAQFNHTDTWYENKMGRDWNIKKNLIEILLYADAELTELALSRLKSFKRRYKNYLQEVSEDRVIEYVLLVEKYILKPGAVATITFRNRLEKLFKAASKSNEDIFVISFLGWLLAKVEKKPVYNVTIEMLRDYFSPSHSA